MLIIEEVDDGFRGVAGFRGVSGEHRGMVVGERGWVMKTEKLGRELRYFAEAAMVWRPGFRQNAVVSKATCSLEQAGRKTKKMLDYLHYMRTDVAKSNLITPKKP